MLDDSSEIYHRWYDKKWLVHILLVLFFPVGIYALWKSRTLPKWWKITGTVIVALILVAAMDKQERMNGTASSDSSTSSVSEDKEDSVNTPATQSQTLPTVGEKLITNYFEVTLNKVSAADRI